MSKNSEQSAYPIFNEYGYSDNKGLTKREYFVAMAMQGFVVNRYAQDLSDRENVAQWCIKLADEVLKQLETK